MAKQAKPAKGKSRSGNPARRAAEETSEGASPAVPELDVSALPEDVRRLLG
jgi:hypothetical protein